MPTNAVIQLTFSQQAVQLSASIFISRPEDHYDEQNQICLTEPLVQSQFVDGKISEAPKADQTIALVMRTKLFEKDAKKVAKAEKTFAKEKLASEKAIQITKPELRAVTTTVASATLPLAAPVSSTKSSPIAAISLGVFILFDWVSTNVEDEQEKGTSHIARESEKVPDNISESAIAIIPEQTLSSQPNVTVNFVHNNEETNATPGIISGAPDVVFKETVKKDEVLHLPIVEKQDREKDAPLFSLTVSEDLFVDNPTGSHSSSTGDIQKAGVLHLVQPEDPLQPDFNPNVVVLHPSLFNMLREFSSSTFVLAALVGSDSPMKIERRPGSESSRDSSHHEEQGGRHSDPDGQRDQLEEELDE